MVTRASPLDAEARGTGGRLGGGLERFVLFAVAAAVFLFTAFLLVRLDVFEREEARQVELNQVRKELDLVRFRLEAGMTGPLVLSRAVAAQIVAHGDIAADEFARVAKELIGDNRNIRDIVVSRGTVVAMVYPLAENRAVLGTDYRDQPGQWPSVSAAIKGRKPVLNGPVRLVQGGSGLIVREPVFLPNPKGGDDILFGLVSVVLDIPATLADAGLDAPGLPIKVAIRGAEGGMITGDEDIFHRDAVEMDVALPFGAWRIAGVAKAAPSDLSGLTTSRVLKGSLLLLVGGIGFGAAFHMAERARARRALIESRHLLQTIIDTLPIRVFWKDRDLRYLGCNPAFAGDAGKAGPDEVIGSDDFQMAWVAQAELYRADDRAVIESGQPRLFYEEPQTTADGRTLWLRTSKAPLKGSDGEVIGLVGTYADITERKRAERELFDKNQALERSNSDLEQFASVASHDLQTPLSNIIRYSQLLERRYKGGLDADADEFIGFIVESGKRMTRLINDLLEFSRISNQGILGTPTAAGQAVAQALDALGAVIGQTGAEIVVGDLPSVMAEHSHLVSLFQNLLGNALKYRSPDRRPRLSVTAERQSPEFWRFAVADNGIGIDPAYHDKIFEIFQRLDPVSHRDGTGIGLTLCRRIVERCGGAISVESMPGVGTTFFFTLRDAGGSSSG